MITDMELECIKYKEKMNAESAVCKHQGDYCKYRASCIIQFICNEKKNKIVLQEDNNRTAKKEKTNNEK